MPKITITLEDTPTGGVAMHSSYSPAVGQPCSLAQQAALEMIARTRHDFGIAPSLDGLTLATAHPCHQTRICGGCNPNCEEGTPA